MPISKTLGKGGMGCLYVFIALFVIGLIGAVISVLTEESNIASQEIAHDQEEISYKIVEERDISYAGCKRVGLSIIVPDDAEKEEVESVMENIINSNKSEWEDITVWAYKNSEENIVGTIGNTMGMKEYSECE